jgi:hypothetical protein
MAFYHTDDIAAYQMSQHYDERYYGDYDNGF